MTVKAPGSGYCAYRAAMPPPHQLALRTPRIKGVGPQQGSELAGSGSRGASPSPASPTRPAARTEASRPFHAALSSVGQVTCGQAAGPWRLPVTCPPPPRPSGSCLHVWKTTEEIKWKHKSATRSLLPPGAETHPLPSPQPGGLGGQQGLPWRGPMALPLCTCHTGVWAPLPGGTWDARLDPSFTLPLKLPDYGYRAREIPGLATPKTGWLPGDGPGPLRVLAPSPHLERLASPSSRAAGTREGRAAL